MTKKSASKHKEEEKDLEEDEEEERDEDEHDDGDEEEEEAAAASDEPRRSRGRAKHDHDDHGNGHDDDEDEDPDAEDPMWWTPHAVMAALVLIGVLGFFGVFNKILGGLAAKPIGGADKPVATSAPTTSPAAQGNANGNGNNAPPAQREEFGAKHLLVQYKGAMRAAPSITRTDDEAKARATEAMKKARSGTKFEDLVKEYSDEPGAGARGGDLGKFKKGQMVPEFQNAVEKMKVGEISDLVKTPFGYHVIQRTQ
jgi:hypothetical protein